MSRSRRFGLRLGERSGLVLALAGLGLLAAASFAMSLSLILTRSSQKTQELVCRSLTLLDETGRECGWLRVDGGMPELVLRDPDSSATTRPGVDLGGPMLWLQDDFARGGLVGAGLVVNGKGSSSLRFARYEESGPAASVSKEGIGLGCTP